METNQLVVGIDLGSADSYVGYVGKGAIDVAQNEVSQRKTPSLVGFTDRERLLGDTALSQIKSNVKNTCRNFKHLLGQKFDSPAVQEELFWATCKIEADADGFAGCSVSYKGEPAVFSAAQVVAMFLTKLKDIAEAWCQGTVADVVIGVPSYFMDFQRTALLDAAKIAGLNVLRVMNEHTATALEYGYFRTNDFDPEKPTTVAFCQMGHVVFSVAIVQYVRGKMTVLCERSGKAGGRDMDECLIRVFAKQFQKKTGCDVLANKKALFKLEDAVGKVKTILSANSESSISCECLMEDEDFGSHIDRSDFLEMCKPMMKKVSDVLDAVKVGSGLPVSAIDSVEMCGGASRVPWVKEMCSKAFGGKDLSTTMNADECVARGCTLQAALLSPLYKVREFKVEDTYPIPVKVCWFAMPAAGGNDDGDVEMVAAEKSAVVFPKNTLMNLLKIMTFFRKGKFDLKAAYADDKALPGGAPTELGTYTVELPAQPHPKKVKVKAALTIHGTFAIQSAQLVEEEDGDAPASDTNTKENEPKEKRKHQEGKEPGADGAQPKRRYKRTSLSVKTAGCPGLAESDLSKHREKEEQMIKEMRDIEETNNKRNELEAYILTMRSSIAEGGKYGPHIAEADRSTLTAQLEKAEDWLYDHPDEVKDVIIGKLAELQVLGDPVVRRFSEESRRPELITGFENAIGIFKGIAQKPGPKHKHVDGARLKSLEAACEEAERWLAGLRERQGKLSRHEDPVLDCASLERRSEELTSAADAILEGRGDAAASPQADGELRRSGSAKLGDSGRSEAEPARKSMDID